MVVDEGVDPSRFSDLEISDVYKTSPHCRCYPPELERPTGFEPAPPSLEGMHIIHLCYGRMELVSGIEPLSAIYETAALPTELYQRRWSPRGESNSDILLCRRSTFPVQSRGDGGR